MLFWPLVLALLSVPPAVPPLLGICVAVADDAGQPVSSVRLVGLLRADRVGDAVMKKAVEGLLQRAARSSWFYLTPEGEAKEVRAGTFAHPTVDARNEADAVRGVLGACDTEGTVFATEPLARLPGDVQSHDSWPRQLEALERRMPAAPSHSGPHPVKRLRTAVHAWEHPQGLVEVQAEYVLAGPNATPATLDPAIPADTIVWGLFQRAAPTPHPGTGLEYWHPGTDSVQSNRLTLAGRRLDFVLKRSDTEASVTVLAEGGQDTLSVSGHQLFLLGG